MKKMIALGAGLAFLAIGSIARAESLVPLNYVDDFGSTSQAFTLNASVAPASPSADRERFSSVYSPNAPGSASSGAKLTLTAPSPVPERFSSVYSPNAPGSSLPTENAVRAEVARSH